MTTMYCGTCARIVRRTYHDSTQVHRKASRGPAGSSKRLRPNPRAWRDPGVDEGTPEQNAAAARRLGL